MRGHQVALLLRPESSLSRLGAQAGRCRVERTVGDADIAALVARLQPEAVIHTACSYGRAGEDAVQLLDANLRLGLVLLQALRSSGQPASFINTGSALAPEVSAYALSKHQFVQWGRRLASPASGGSQPSSLHLQRSGLQFINLSLQHMYGPGDHRSKFTTHVLHACHSNQARLQLTAGEQARDFIHIDDVVSAYDTVLARAHSLAAFDEIEVGSGEAPTVREFVDTVHQLTASRTVLEFGALPYRPNEAMHCRADTRRLRGLGWRPALGLRAGLQHTIAKEFPS